MGKNHTNIKVEASVILALEKCKIEFIKHHPEFSHYQMSYNFIINKIIEYYLK